MPVRVNSPLLPMVATFTESARDGRTKVQQESPFEGTPARVSPSPCKTTGTRFPPSWYPSTLTVSNKYRGSVSLAFLPLDLIVTEAVPSEVVSDIPVRPSLRGGSLIVFLAAVHAPVYFVTYPFGLLVLAAENGNTRPKPPSESGLRDTRLLRTSLTKVPPWVCESPMINIFKSPDPRKRMESSFRNTWSKPELSAGKWISFFPSCRKGWSGISLRITCP